MAALRFLDWIIRSQSHGGSSVEETTFFSANPVESHGAPVLRGGVAGCEGALEAVANVLA